ncbi:MULTISPECIES: TetR/AcrR family transcriptional regulator [Arthrobacter]|uniref:TetR/AcrR family transcriptional regulator n=1 Tax=Arthrobacter sunyaminii TaxID=2816859 RepID=A0A975PE13_9MICC|nr:MULTISPECIES: TetR/AcrR family transcriptional regulator [Arthrobacter]MBO0897185.1 TetR/AcrR family transcriptional regulator [Arthrobacter sunyaminii]MBO0908417.1 TetR/AcrR family transcriptional regulator [Arthrobacter sunyaminii]QWQ36031.1 TetR/AcrR family transcriptional regulator [Arthrobacter sunyaminii]
MDQGVEASGGLRARKRAAARSEIEKTAVALVLERGYDNVTVDMICTASMVSQRTFFNYFGSKEGVFLGPPPAQMRDAVAREFLPDHGTPVVLSLAAAVVSALVAGQPDPELAGRRMKAIMASPVLFSKQNEWMADHEKQLTDLVMERYAAAGLRKSEPDLAAEAGMVVGLALGVVRVVLQQNHLEHDDVWPDTGIMDRAGVLLERIFGS